MWCYHVPFELLRLWVWTKTVQDIHVHLHPHLPRWAPEKLWCTRTPRETQFVHKRRCEVINPTLISLATTWQLLSQLPPNVGALATCWQSIQVLFRRFNHHVIQLRSSMKSISAIQSESWHTTFARENGHNASSAFGFRQVCSHLVVGCFMPAPSSLGMSRTTPYSSWRSNAASVAVVSRSGSTLRCSPSYIAPLPCSSDQWSSTHSSNVIAHAPPSPDSDENRTFSLSRDSPGRAFDSRISPYLTVPLDLLGSGVVSVATPSNFKRCRTPEVSSNDDLDLMWLASRPSVVGVSLMDTLSVSFVSSVCLGVSE